MYLIVWRYRVAATERTAFEEAYGPAGDWVRLFGAGDGYLGTELVSGDEPGDYLTIDRWTSAAASDAFKKAHGGEYRRLDDAMAELTDDEELVFTGSSRGWPGDADARGRVSSPRPRST